MLICEKAVYDMESGRLLSWEGYEYEGPISLNKGENRAGEAASSQQMALQNKIASDQLAQQKKFADPTFAAMVHYLTDQHGFSPEQASQLTSQFLDQQAQRFGGAAQGVTTALARRGSGMGDQPVGGDFTRGIAALRGMQAATTSAGLRDINLADVNLANQNKFNTASMFLGIAPSFGNQAVGFGSNAGQALGDYVKASTPQPSPWFGVLGAALGAAGTAATGSIKCHIASALYGGWFSVRAMKARKWLGEWEKRSKFGKLIVTLYAKYGERLSKYRIVCLALKPAFDYISE